MDITTMINSLGLPVAGLVILWIAFNSQSKQIREDGNKREEHLLKSSELIREDGNKREKALLDANKEFAIALNKASDAIAENGKLSLALYERMHTVECKIDTVNIKVDALKITLSQAVNE